MRRKLEKESIEKYRDRRTYKILRVKGRRR